MREPLDFYETPAWVTEALLKEFRTFKPYGSRVLDPGCGTGSITQAAINAGYHHPKLITGVDVDLDRVKAAQARIPGPHFEVGDFLQWPDGVDFDLVVANPPFSLAFEFAIKAMKHAPTVCFLLRLNWLESQRREAFHRLYPADLYVLPKRPSFKGNGKTDATGYAWFVWGGPLGGGHWQILKT